MAEGYRYQEHGISTGSVLFCQRAAEINDGDLIVVKENGAFALYLYLKDRKAKADGKKRILHNKSKAYAKVLGSFNFYHIHANAHGYELLYQSEVASNGQ